MDNFFDRIPQELISSLSVTCHYSDVCIKEIIDSAPGFFQSISARNKMKSLHEKVAHHYFSLRADSFRDITVSFRHTSRGDYIPVIKADNFMMHISHLPKNKALPTWSQYKEDAAVHNPEQRTQLSLFSPPINNDYSFLYFVTALEFEQNETSAKIIVPDNTFFYRIGTPMVIPKTYINESFAEDKEFERHIPSLIKEVKKDNEGN